MACEAFVGAAGASTSALVARRTNDKRRVHTTSPAAALFSFGRGQGKVCACLRRQQLSWCLERVNSSGPFSAAKLKRRAGIQVRAEAVAGTVDKIKEVRLNTFYDVLGAAGDKLVVLDMYTQWCGPCKLMYPKLVEAADKYEEAVFIKLDCNQENKPLAKSLGIKAVPTFKLFKNKEQVHEIQGAKYDALIEAIEKYI